MTRGKLVLVPFPFDDLSAISPLLKSDLELDPGHPDFAATGLHGKGTIRLHRLMTVSTSLIRRELGSLSAALQAEVETRLKALFSL